LDKVVEEADRGGERMVKVVIPVEDKEGKRMSAHFGRSPYFAWFEVQSGKIVDRGVVNNDSNHFGGHGLPPERMMALGAEVVISMGMGISAIQSFQNNTVAVLQATNDDTEQTIRDFTEGKLKELTEGCLHGKEHEH